MALCRHHHLKAQRLQAGLYAAFELLAMLQRARRVVSHPWAVFAAELLAELLHEAEFGVEQPFAQVSRGAGHLVGHGAAQLVAKVFDHDAAAAGIAQHSFHLAELVASALGQGAHVAVAAFDVAQVGLQGTAAAFDVNGLNAKPIQHAHRGGMDVGRHGRLHTALEQQDAARVGVLGRLAGPLARWHLGFETGRQQRPRQAAHGQGRAEQRGGQAAAE